MKTKINNNKFKKFKILIYYRYLHILQTKSTIIINWLNLSGHQKLINQSMNEAQLRKINRKFASFSPINKCLSSRKGQRLSKGANFSNFSKRPAPFLNTSSKLNLHRKHTWPISCTWPASSWLLLWKVKNINQTFRLWTPLFSDYLYRRFE